MNINVNVTIGFNAEAVSILKSIAPSLINAEMATLSPDFHDAKKATPISGALETPEAEKVASESSLKAVRKPASEKPKAEKETVEEKPSVSLEALQTKVAEKAASNKEAVKALLKSYGVGKTSDLPVSEYDNFLSQLKDL